LKTVPKSLKQLPTSGIQALFFDIDDTFSGGLNADGKHTARILSEAYESLWKLYNEGIKVIPVTGRPAGWCDHIARMWPVSAVIGENGSFYCTLDETKKPYKLVKKYLESEAVRLSNAKKLEKLRKELFKKFNGAKSPSDQHYREFDLAIDFCEDVVRWPDKKVNDLIQFCQSKGAIAKLSSIHINIWFGKYNKLSCVNKFIKEQMKMTLPQAMDKIVYIGDSPNDEPFFQHFKNSVGVQNVSKFLKQLQFPPAYITDQESGRGFKELVDHLTKK
jgi:HAD superfamily hydrolase (TIGR01484 family)